MVTALLHDIGKLVLMHAYPGYPAQVHGEARTPEERIHRERRELGVDHALVGGVLARRWGLPKSLASTIERHHADDADRGGRLRPPRRHARPLRAGRRRLAGRAAQGARATIGLGPAELRARDVRPALPAERPRSARSTRARCRIASSRCSSAWPRARSTSRSPPSSQLSTSTVRTHLHNIYGKLGAVDRAQAVLRRHRARLDLAAPARTGGRARGRRHASNAGGDARSPSIAQSIGRAVAAVHEGLVDLVGGGVGERDRRGRTTARDSGAPAATGTTAAPNSAVWTILRRIRSTSPRPVLRSGCARQEEDQRHQGEGRQEAAEKSHKVGIGRRPRMISITTKSPYALQALTELGAQRRRGAGPDRRAGPPARHPGAVPRAALRRPAPGRACCAPSAA